MKDFIRNNSSNRNIYILFGLYCVFNIYLIPNIFMGSERPIDLKFTYSVETTYDFIESYNKEKSQKYMFGEFIIDTVYPIIMSLLLSFSIYFLYKKIKLAILPLIILVIDYLENIGILILIYSYPTKLLNLALVTSGLTTLKWVSFITCLLIVLIGIMRKLYLKYR